MKLKNSVLPALTSLLVILLLSSCEVEDSMDVNQDKIYADYEVFYNSNSDKTSVIARFKFGGPTGTNLILSDPASVSFDGDKLEYNALLFGHFKEYAGRIESGTFTYTNVDEEVFVNEIPAYDTIDFPSDLDTLSKSQAYTLVWEGTPLNDNETVGLFIGSWAWGDDALFIQTAKGATDLVLGTDQLANVQSGQTTFFMDRYTALDVAEGTGEGGKVRSKFRAKNINVVVVD